MTEWMKGEELEKREQNGNLGGTMRLGAYDAVLAKGSKIAEIYGTIAHIGAPPSPLRGQHALPQ